MLLKIYAIVAVAAVLTSDCLADDSIIDNMKKEISEFGQAVGDKVGKAVDSVKEHLSHAKDGIEHQVDNVKDHLSHAKDTMSDHAKDVKENVHDAKEAVEDKLDDGGSFFENVGKGLRNAMHTVGEKFGEATDYIGEKIGVIKPKSEDLGDKAKDAAGDALDKIEDEIKSLHRSRLVRRSIEA